jgi:hypothetical protein
MGLDHSCGMFINFHADMSQDLQAQQICSDSQGSNAVEESDGEYPVFLS